MRRMFVAVLAGAISLLAGCGYQFQGSGSVLPEDVKSVAILPSENLTTEPGLGPKLTEALRSRFERYGVVKVVESAREADAVLISKIQKVDTVVRNTSSGTDIELDVELMVQIDAVLKRRNGQVLWKADGMRVTQPFAGVAGVVVTTSSSFVTGNISQASLNTLGAREVSRGQKQQALDDIVDELARKLYNSAVAADF